MLKLLKMLFWLVLVLVVCGGLDQFLVRVPIDTPGISQAQTFYVDFRARLLGLIGVDGAVQPASIEQVIEERGAPATKKSTETRYLYADETGTLQFADSLELVPAKFRKDAQPLAE